MAKISPTVGFIGKHDLRIDDKGRVTMPARFKSVLKEQYADDDMQVVVSVSLDLNLRVLPLSQYAKMTEEYEQFSDLDEEARRLKEFLTGLATIEKIDAGGRIRLSGDLREIASLDKDVALIGRNNSFEIWDRNRWTTTQSATLRDLKHLTEQVRQKNSRH
jgi:MraZ protein